MSDSYKPIFPTFDQGDSSTRSLTSQKLWETELDGHQPILSLLAIASRLDCNIFPLIWGSEMAGLGEGATGKISQSPLNAQISFAYKRFSRRPSSDATLTRGERLHLLYKALICELIVLHHRELYDHPNIIKLEGICWEVVQDFNEIWPVLVFRKADLGTLDHYLTRPESKDLDMTERVVICGEVAKALRIMHLCGLVHGDIKPQNILVFKSIDGDSEGVQVTDLGYACLGTKDDDLVLLPQSRPWQAPEYSTRWVTAGAAKRMDVYSFGLLVFWLLFRYESLSDADEIGISICNAFEGDKEHSIQKLERLKQNDELLDRALQLLSKQPGLNIELTNRLKMTFELSLGGEPTSRASDMKPFVRLLCDDSFLEPVDHLSSAPPIAIQDWHGMLQISDVFVELDACDLRVQQFVLKELIGLSNYDKCLRCSSNAAFQLALCYRIGFGAIADSSKVKYWLDRSHSTLDVLMSRLVEMKEKKPSLSSMRQVVKLGFQSQLSTDYEDAGILTDAIEYYRKLLLSRVQSLGNAHYSCRILRDKLAGLFRENEDCESAALLLEEDIDIQKSLYGSDVEIEPLFLSNLAKNYSDLHRFEESKRLYEEVISSYGDRSDARYLLISALYEISAMTLQSGDANGALHKAVEAANQSEEHLGTLHPNTWKAKGILSRSCNKLGQKQKAIQIRAEILQSQIQVHGRGRPETIDSMRELGHLYTENDQWQEAKDMYAAVLEATRKSDGQSQQAVFNARANYAATLARAGEAAEAARELQNIISQMENSQHTEEANLMAFKVNLATAFQLQNLYDKAEPLWWEALNFYRGIGDEKTHLVLVSLKALADLYYSQQKWSSAIRSSSEYLGIVDRHGLTIVEDHVYTLTIKIRSEIQEGLWNDALLSLRTEVSWRAKLNLLATADGLQARLLLATTYLELRKLDPARLQIAKILESFLQLQSAKKSWIESIGNLVEICTKKQLFEEAEELLKMKIMIRHAFLDKNEVDTQDDSDRETIMEIRRARGIHIDDIVFSPTNIIERYQGRDDDCIATDK